MLVKFLIPTRADGWLQAALRAIIRAFDDSDMRISALVARVGELEAQLFNPPVPLLQGYYYAVSANYSVDPASLGRFHYVDCTGAVTATLPYLDQGAFIELFNVGSGTLTVKDSTGSTISTIAAGKHQIMAAGTANAVAAVSI